MKVTTENINDLKRKLEILIPAQDVTKEFQETYKELQKHAKVKGFRQGHIPKSYIQNLFNDSLKKEIANQLIKDSWPKAIMDNKLDPITAPKFDFSEPVENQDFKYTAEFEIRPELNLENYKGIEIEVEKIKIKDEEIDNKIKKLQENFAVLKNITEDRPLANEDFAEIEFDIISDTITKEKDKKFTDTVQLGKGHLIKDIEDKMTGMKKGETRAISYKFPEQHPDKKLQNKEITYNIKLLEIKYRELPKLDDAFAKSLGKFKTLLELTDSTKKDISKEKEMHRKYAARDLLMDKLIEKNDVKLPETLLANEIERQKNIHAKALETKDEKEKQKKETEIKEAATKSLKKLFIVDKIAKKENFSATDKDANDRLQNLVKSFGPQFEKGLDAQQKENMINNLKMDIIEEKVFDLLYANAKISEK